MTGHDDIFEYVPSAPLTEHDGFDDDLSHVRSLEIRDVVGSVEPRLEFRVDSSLKLKRYFPLVFGQFVVFSSKCVDPILSLLRNRAREVDGDEVSSFRDFPVRQPSAPKGDGFRFPGHDGLL